MEQSLAAMQIALRVLKALNQKMPPDEKDLEELRQLAPLFPDLSPDELACEVIQLALKHRARVREDR